MADPIQLVPNRPDAELATELKEEAIKLHEPLLALLDKANADGFGIAVQCGMGPLGKHVITQIQIVKVYK